MFVLIDGFVLAMRSSSEESESSDNDNEAGFFSSFETTVLLTGGAFVEVFENEFDTGNDPNDGIDREGIESTVDEREAGLFCTVLLFVVMLSSSLLLSLL